MLRRLLKRGYCTTMISLPRAWVQANRLKFDDSVELHITKKALTINPAKAMHTIAVDMRCLRPWSTHYLSQLYQAGYQTITVHHATKKDQKTVKEWLWNFPGTKIVLGKKFTLQITDYKSPYTVFLNELFQHTEQFLSLTKETPSKTIERLRKEIYALNELSTRKINLEVPEMDLYYYHEVPFCLFLANKLFYECLQYCKIRNMPIPPQFATLLQLTKRYLKTARSTIIGKHSVNLKTHICLRKKLFHEPQENHDFFTDTRPEEFFIAEKIVHIARTIAIMNSKYALFPSMNKLVPASGNLNS